MIVLLPHPAVVVVVVVEVIQQTDFVAHLVHPLPTGLSMVL